MSGHSPSDLALAWPALAGPSSCPRATHCRWLAGAHCTLAVAGVLRCDWRAYADMGAVWWLSPQPLGRRMAHRGAAMDSTTADQPPSDAWSDQVDRRVP